jgi:hypothetical protein
MIFQVWSYLNFVILGLNFIEIKNIIIGNEKYKRIMDVLSICQYFEQSGIEIFVCYGSLQELQL